ncbi:cation/H(+) antiporter 24-like [Actinidia eriantha]|uniref:cation/H(+) antiporter 24-like n=1 Tax=Actinidia eriantha TaxID=165200 RepID=UPI002583A54F|nr:cation/H(+) antiporter 24-like [Actinidia eriantha]
MVKETGQAIEFICRATQATHPPGIFYGESPLDYSFTLVLLEVTLIVLITRILAFLLKPLKQPRIVSDILGGIIIGPSVLGRNKKFAASVFPDNSTYVFKNMGLIGFVYFLFLSGVKMDLTTIRKTGKKQLYLALFGILIPFVTVVSIAIAIRKSLDKELAKGSVIGGVASAFSITAFPVLHQIIKELNLLSSEVGKLALSTVLVSDVIGMLCIVLFEAAREWEAHSIDALWYVLSCVGIMVVVVSARQAMIWVVRITPEGKPVGEAYVVAILLGVLVIAFMSDISGVAIANGPLWLGLAVPDGPPLGATLVERTDTIINEFFMPMSFAFVGMYTDISSLRGQWSSLLPLFVMLLIAYLTKFVTILLVSRFFEMPDRDGLTLSLVISLRGQLEILIFMHWMDLEIIQVPSFTMLVLSTTIVTAIATPLISILYDPTRPYMVNKRRAIQYTPPNTELHMVACIHDQESVAGFIDLLEVTNPTVNCPFSVYALRLIELLGRASPVFIDHENQARDFEHTSYNHIHNALKNFQESRGEEFIKFHLFTSVSPIRTMFQDICELALMKKATFIILPFKRDGLETQTEVVNHGVLLKSVNANVLAHAPCSVGILVDKGDPFRTNVVNYSMRHVAHQLAVLYLGGADAREALAYADRMTGNPNVSLTVIRFLSYNGEGDNEMEKKLDDGLVTWFWVKNEGNQRVIYREVVVKNGQDTIAAIRAMNSDCYNLWIVGRKQGINPVLIEGLSDWSQNPELGIIGDFIGSMDLGSNASVLVVQQQILREGASGGLLGRFSCCTY